MAWGGGFCEERGREAEAERIYHGGIYMASTVAGSTRVWNAKIERPGEVVRELGDIEHLRPLLGEGTTLGAGALSHSLESCAVDAPAAGCAASSS